MSLNKGKPSKYAVPVPESIIEQSAAYFGEEDNNFTMLLEVSRKYKEANMTPIFLFDQAQNTLYCVAQETYNKKLH